MELTDEQVEHLARSLHERYRRLVSPAPAVPWEELDEEGRDANRAGAAGVPAVVAAAGLEVVPVTEATVDRLSDAEVEAASEAEHERWARRASDDHPDRVPYASLSEADQDKDRDRVRPLPRLLAEVGLGLRRGATSDSGPR